MAPDASGNAAALVLNERFEIWPDSPLPQLDLPHVGAYAAADSRNSNDKVFALVCEPDLPHRTDILARLRKPSDADLLQLRDYGILHWPPGQGFRFVLVYDIPPGPRLVSTLDGQQAPMEGKEVISRVLAPVAGALQRLSQCDVTHRAIRPTNMFVGGDDRAGVILGECAAVPPALDQPPAFETIESLMADRAGRGAGQTGDDIYALGVSVLALATGKDPAAGRDRDQILADKMTRGSYHALVGPHRLPEALRDLLHGLLEDRPHARWSLKDLQAWLEDRETRRAGSSEAPKPDRGFSFGGRVFHDPRALAAAMASDWSSVSLNDGGHEILKWVRQSLGDDAIAGRLLAAIELSKRDQIGVAGVANPALVARLCMALDKAAPLRYKNFSAHVDGLGAVLGAHFSDQEFLRDAGEVFQHELLGCHTRMLHGTQGNGPAMVRLFSRYSHFVKDGGHGGGVERCLYELNSSQYCRSPLIADQKVMRLDDLLPALETAAARGHKGPPMDRHIAAFIAAHVEINIDSFLKGLNEKGNSENAALGMLGLLATVAAHTKPGRCPKLARWIGAHVSPLVESYHHRVWRAKAEAALPNVIKSGDVVAIYSFLANGEARQRDRDGYAMAVARCQRIDQEIEFLSSDAAVDPEKAAACGHGLAVLLSAMVGLGAVATTLALTL